MINIAGGSPSSYFVSSREGAIAVAFWLLNKGGAPLLLSKAMATSALEHSKKIPRNIIASLHPIWDLGSGVWDQGSG